MKISWVLANQLKDPLIDPEALQNVGSTWGGWPTWRAYQTDNVLADEKSVCTDLVNRNFQQQCNLYVPQRLYAELNRPDSVNLYNGEFATEFDNKEDIISMHLTATMFDVVLLLGFDLQQTESTDAYTRHKHQNYLNAFAGAVKQNSETQWVLVDHSDRLPDNVQNLPNIACDSYSNVLEYFKD